ncbi:DUF2213 domain-containing protein [Sinorhizobium meliloti]|uniref:DUF2213 domain-containing protein n=1 Tax=Rhizobium meliloti TaxID=382 RepID=UPI003F5CD31D
MKFTDLAPIAGTRRTADGYLVADVRTARTGIQVYAGHEVGKPELQVVKVYRPEDQVFDKASLGSYAHKPVTNDHPDVAVTADNWKALSVGQIGDEVARDGEFVRVPLVVMDGATIGDIEGGKRELSAGYTCDLAWEPGTTPEGETYDAIQKDIRINHVAIVQRGRAGSEARITEDTKQMARERIEAGYAKGQGPNTIALDIAGRVNRVTGRREGGLLGMTSQLARTVENARAALLSGDVEGMKHYLTLTRRDKRFDRQIAKAIREGKPLPADAVQKITGRLADRYVQLRAQTIARTETQSSVHAAKHEAYQQGLDRAGRDASMVTRRWRSVGDGRVRHTHQVLNAEEVTGMDLPFQSPSGAMMRFPGDTSLGAGAAEIIGCRCHVEYNFDFAEEYARSRGR